VAEFGQYFGNGLALGCIYALMALGLTLIFGYMNVVNFAHGEFYMIGAFFAYTLVTSAHVSFWLALAGAAAGAAVLGLGADRFLLRSLRRHDEIAMPMLATIGLSIALQNLATIIWNPNPKTMGSPIRGDTIDLVFMRTTPQRIFVVVLAVAVIAGAHVFLNRTRVGLSMRATFQDDTASWLMGVNVNRIYALTFAFGSALAAVSGVLIATIFQITPAMGGLATAKAFVVVILGGLGSFPGAVIGGLVVGVTESLAAGYVSSGFQDTIGLLVLVAVLMFRPQGIFGSRQVVAE
jgi:branched-chain amino acid transport system permease protein